MRKITFLCIVFIIIIIFFISIEKRISLDYEREAFLILKNHYRIDDVYEKYLSVYNNNQTINQGAILMSNSLCKSKLNTYNFKSIYIKNTVNTGALYKVKKGIDFNTEISENHDIAMISTGVAAQLFGGIDVIGEIISIDNRNYAIVAVVELRDYLQNVEEGMNELVIFNHDIENIQSKDFMAFYVSGEKMYFNNNIKSFLNSLEVDQRDIHIELVDEKEYLVFLILKLIKLLLIAFLIVLLLRMIILQIKLIEKKYRLKIKESYITKIIVQPRFIFTLATIVLLIRLQFILFKYIENSSKEIIDIINEFKIIL